MRLLKTPSHTSERLGYEAEKERQEKRKMKGAYPKLRENVNGNHRHFIWKRGGGGENVSTEERKPKVAPPPHRGG